MTGSIEMNPLSHRLWRECAHAAVSAGPYTGRVSEALTIDIGVPIADRLQRRAALSGEDPGAKAQRLLDEGLRMEAYPGILFRDGSSGRRAALAAGPDVSEVVSVVRRLGMEEQAAVDDAASWLSLSPDQVRAALGYYAEFTDEIDDRIRRNDEAARRVEASLGGPLGRLVRQILVKRYPSSERLEMDQVVEVVGDLLVMLDAAPAYGRGGRKAPAGYRFLVHQPQGREGVSRMDVTQSDRDAAPAALHLAWEQQGELPERLRGLSEDEISEDIVQAVREVRAELRAEIDTSAG